MLVLGLWMAYFFSVVPITHMLQARNWAETPCVLLDSMVWTDSSPKSWPQPTERVTYSYIFGGRHFVSSCYQFTEPLHSGSAMKPGFFNRYSPGDAEVCYVDPANPSNAAMNRGFTSNMVFFGGVGLVTALFVAIGLVAGIHNGPMKFGGITIS